ncbi:hypothetical protein ISR94_03645 [Candidatus Microgenomates bacterium]|nr:hypothetical protein [Candidatus Microgenomates bacterium]
MKLATKLVYCLAQAKFSTFKLKMKQKSFLGDKNNGVNAVAVYFLFFLFLILFTINTRLLNVSAQIPSPKIPCEGEESPEFNSLRPYQASPCGDSSKTYFCGNNIIIYEEVQETVYDCSITELNVNKTIKKTYEIEMSDLELPILGNTELTKNSSNNIDQIDDAQKMNEYLSWYLNGVNERAEYPFLSYNDEGDIRKLIDFSGPIKKLLSQESLTRERIETIEATRSTSFDSVGTPVVQLTGDTGTDSEVERHNQIVGCTTLFGIPVPCYSGLAISEHRLRKWEENDKLPPLREEFDTYADYYKEYRKWRGDRCLVFNIPVINKEVLLCFDDPTRANYWSTLFPYIPLSSTEDKNAKQPINFVQVKEIGKTEVDFDEAHKYDILDEVALSFPHTQEGLELSEILNSSYLPKDAEKQKVDGKTVESEKDDLGQCRLIDVRSNPGDDLFAEVDPNSYKVKVTPYTIKTIPCDGACKQEKVCEPHPIPGYPKICTYEYSKTCSGGVSITIDTSVKIPNAKEIFKNTTAGDGSTFRKIFPKVQKGAPVECLANIPTVTTAQYKAVSGTSEIEVQEPDGTKTDGVDAKVHFPYIGSIYEYFLKGVQTALRPKGYGEPITSGQCGGPTCGELPDNLPRGSGTCALGGISSRVGDIPDSLAQIVEAAAQTYNVPPNLILGVMYGEGLFGGGNEKDWTDENVKAWASCEPVPDCNSGDGDDGFMGFFKTDWDNSVKDAIAPDLKALDPNRLQPDRCNLLDAVYGLAWDLHNNADGGSQLPLQCFGIDLRGNVPSSCSWSNENYASAIKVAGNGYLGQCFTQTGGCSAGNVIIDGESAVECPDEDTCETVFSGRPYTSHFGCVWDVGHGN